MGLVNKIIWLKRVFQILLVINVFLIGAGAVALSVFLKTHEVSALQMALVGGATLLIGFILPLFIIASLTQAALKARKQTEEAAAKLISGWIGYQDQEKGVADPIFWLKMVLLGAEVWGENARHPMASSVAQFAPVLRKELGHVSQKRKRRHRGKRPSHQVEKKVS